LLVIISGPLWRTPAAARRLADGRGQHREPVRFLVFSASLRRCSLKTRLADLAAAAIESGGGTVDVAAMRDLDAPSYDQDVQRDEGFPPGAEEFRRRLEACQAFVVALPEYNASMPGALKNAIDWVSRYQPQLFNERHGLLMSASPSMIGGNRGLWALRVPFEHLGARLYPDMFSLARAHLAFTAEGRIADEQQQQQRFDVNIANFMDLVEASTLPVREAGLGGVPGRAPRTSAGPRRVTTGAAGVRARPVAAGARECAFGGVRQRPRW
jgi:chromate reductase, NAD(P)H dehydrogenase (quinone)